MCFWGEINRKGHSANVLWVLVVSQLPRKFSSSAQTLSKHKNFLLALTCTQKLQKWHRPSFSDKAKAKVKTESHIRLKYFRNVRSARKAIYHKRSKRKFEFRPSETVTDIDRSDWFRRDVCEISHKVQDSLGSINIDISNHFFKCLTKYK